MRSPKKPRKPKPEPMRDEGDLGPLGVADANGNQGTIMGHGD